MDKITFFYKSGQKVHLRAKNLIVTWNREQQAITKLAWDEMEPRPVFANLSDIESVWNGHV